jgi:hypothetical protein
VFVGTGVLDRPRKNGKFAHDHVEEHVLFNGCAMQIFMNSTDGRGRPSLQTIRYFYHKQNLSVKRNAVAPPADKAKRLLFSSESIGTRWKNEYL